MQAQLSEAGTVLVADLGGTNVRLRALDATGAIIQELTTTGSGSEDGTLQATLDELRAVLGTAEGVARTVGSLVLASRGFSISRFRADARARQTLLDIASRVNARRVILVPDGIASYLGLLGTAPGVVVSVGTGTIVITMDHAGDVSKLDGLGPLLGDVGSGYWVGLKGLRCACLWQDRRTGGSARLYAAAEQAFGDVRQLPYALAPGGRIRSVAAFATEVVAAFRAGDQAAAAILDAAADAITGLAADAVALAGAGAGQEIPLVLSGGFMAAVPELAAKTTSRVRVRGISKVSVRAPAVLDGCQQIAAHGVPQPLSGWVDQMEVV